MTSMIEISHLSKCFGEIQAVQDLSFQVGEGELFAFLGINGAGKSTTINILCGQLAKDAGTVVIGGKNLERDVDSVKSMLGVVFQQSVLDPQLSVLDNLKCRAALYGLHGVAFRKRLDELSRLLAMEELLKRPVGKLSGGQRRRIDVARALLHKPKLLILDEPTTGLDPQTRKMLWGIIAQLRREEQMTVFLTTHYMEEAAEADHVVIIDGGRILAEGTPLELKNQYTGDYITLYGVSEGIIRSLGGAYEAVPNGYRLSVPNTAFATELILKHPQVFRNYEVTMGKMDDVFLSVTGKKLTGGAEK